MACLDMYSNTTNQNSDHKSHSCSSPRVSCSSPRISFSNDFADSHHHRQPPLQTSAAAASSDFEFSVANYSMMSADELFFKGRLLPFKNQSQQKPTTLREELLVDDDDDDEDDVGGGGGGSGGGGGFSLRPPKGSNRWKGILGLKKGHTGSRKAGRAADGSAERRPNVEAQVSKSPQELLNDGGSSCRDVEFGM